jgi:hypothetical protein
MFNIIHCYNPKIVYIAFQWQQQRKDTRVCEPCGLNNTKFARNNLQAVQGPMPSANQRKRGGIINN